MFSGLHTLSTRTRELKINATVSVRVYFEGELISRSNIDIVPRCIIQQRRDATSPRLINFRVKWSDFVWKEIFTKMKMKEKMVMIKRMMSLMCASMKSRSRRWGCKLEWTLELVLLFLIEEVGHVTGNEPWRSETKEFANKFSGSSSSMQKVTRQTGQRRISNNWDQAECWCRYSWECGHCMKSPFGQMNEWTEVGKFIQCVCVVIE